ncbi:MAG: GAF domain-containing protein [Gammaproteobacteria bacterium]|nr:GAF domain-containing protein [Gammaproteobacteria bacterium]MDH3411038.1 GAF domain-containing protein [Gammaproteobacteria bacterium]
MSDKRLDTREEVLKLEQDNDRLRHEILALRQFIDSMQNLVDALEHPKQEFEIMELLSEVLKNALETINAKDGSLLVLDEDTRELVFVVTHGDLPIDKLVWRRLPPGAGIGGWVAKNQKSVVVNDVQSDERFYPAIDEEFGFKTRSMLAVPVVGGGQVLGVIEVLNKHDGKLFNHDDQTLLTLMCRFSGELLSSVIQQNESNLKQATAPRE